MDLYRKTIVITGGKGFLGKQVCNKLRERGLVVEGDSHHPTVFTPGSSDFDLTKEQSVKAMYLDIKPEVVIHLAAVVGV